MTYTPTSIGHISLLLYIIIQSGRTVEKECMFMKIYALKTNMREGGT